MSFLTVVVTVALGWLLAVGIETKEGWRPPFYWFGWRDVHPFGRGVGALLAGTLLLEWLTEGGWPHGELRGVVLGLVVLQVLLGAFVALQVLRWVMYAHIAHALLRKTGLTDREIFALNHVNERSPFEDLSPALSGFRKLGDRVGAVQAAFAHGAAEKAAARQPSSPANSSNDSRYRVYSISDLIWYYALSNQGQMPGVWQDCYLALCRAYHVPPDWEHDQTARMRGNEWRDQEEVPEQRPYNLHYASHRLAFERVRLEPLGHLVGPGDGELDQAVHQRLIAAYDALQAPLRELDRAFFAGIYNAPAALTFVEITLVVHYAFPDSAIQVEEWAASL